MPRLICSKCINIGDLNQFNCSSSRFFPGGLREGSSPCSPLSQAAESLGKREKINQRLKGRASMPAESETLLFSAHPCPAGPNSTRVPVPGWHRGAAGWAAKPSRCIPARRGGSWDQAEPELSQSRGCSFLIPAPHYPAAPGLSHEPHPAGPWDLEEVFVYFLLSSPKGCNHN